MTIYVFSDSHGSLHEMLSVVKAKEPDLILHLGDGAQDAEDLATVYDHIPLYRVPGNCDMFDPTPPVQQLELEGFRFLFSHGHLWSVKQRKDILLATAQKEKADIVLYGHTHIPDAHQEASGLWVLNPGAAPQSYGVVTIEEGEIRCETFPSFRGEL